MLLQFKLSVIIRTWRNEKCVNEWCRRTYSQSVFHILASMKEGQNWFSFKMLGVEEMVLGEGRKSHLFYRINLLNFGKKKNNLHINKDDRMSL